MYAFGPDRRKTNYNLPTAKKIAGVNLTAICNTNCKLARNVTILYTFDAFRSKEEGVFPGPSGGAAIKLSAEIRMR